MLELTTRFSGITTSGKARSGGLSPRDASRKAAARLSYICRPQAVGEAAWAGTIHPKTGVEAGNLSEAQAALRQRVRERITKGGKTGSRILESGIVSLPNSWDDQARREACERISQHLAPTGSEAAALAVSHRDKQGNAHLHYAATDGLESIEAARRRRPNAKRVRRAQVIRMTDGGRPKELRRELAGMLNEIARKRGIDGVEWRSFETRGIKRQASRHDGPTKRARIARLENALEGFWVEGPTGSDFLNELAQEEPLGIGTEKDCQTTASPQASVSQNTTKAAQERAQRLRKAVLALPHQEASPRAKGLLWRVLRRRGPRVRSR